jgi:Sec-independent protein secretion pathway component TatC
MAEVALLLVERARSMSLISHLEELRKRIILSVCAVVVGFLSCWSFADRIFGFMQLSRVTWGL